MADEDKEKSPKLSFIDSSKEESVPITEDTHSDVENTAILKLANEESYHNEYDLNSKLAMGVTTEINDAHKILQNRKGELNSTKIKQDTLVEQYIRFSLEQIFFQGGRKVLKDDEAREYTRKFYHTILCIDTSKSMRASKQTTCSCIRQLLREIPERNPEIEEIISVVCFGKYIRVYKYDPENPMGHIQFINDVLESQIGSWIGCTPLSSACNACIDTNTTVKEELDRRMGNPVFMQGRIVMFTDGKSTSTSQRPDEDDENYNPMESMERILLWLQSVWTRCREFKLPIFSIISSYHNTDQNFLLTMSISTNGKILLHDEISTFAKFIDIELKANILRSDCRNFNWHQVFAYLRMNLGHQDLLYYDYATELILRMNNQNISFGNHNGLPRLIRRYPKQGIFGWQERNQLRDWIYFPTEISDEIEKGYCTRLQRQLDTFTIERENTNQEIDVLRFDFANFSYRNIGIQGPQIDIRRIFMGNDWG